MLTHAAQIGTIWHVSPLRRRLAREGLCTLAHLIELARLRGCRQLPPQDAVLPPLHPAQPDNEELVVALLLLEWPFEPMAHRAAACLASSADPLRLARLARRERVEVPLLQIARAGLANDPEDAPHWKALVDALPDSPNLRPGILPHPSRYMSQPGYRPGKSPPARWLKPR